MLDRETYKKERAVCDKAQMTKQTTRYRVLRDFDYLSAGRVYSFSFGKCWINVRRVEDPEIGTFIQPWQFRQALERGWLKAA